MRFSHSKLIHCKGLHLVDTGVALLSQRRHENCDRLPLGSICVTNAEFNAGKSQRGFHSKKLIVAEMFAIRDGHLLRPKLKHGVLRGTKPWRLDAADHGFAAFT
jgi:hypothetical protein